jgi:hypothetical protein
MTVLVLTRLHAGGASPLNFRVRRMINAGFVGRDRASVQAHIDELAHEGVAPPATVPVLFPMLLSALAVAPGGVDVIGRRTSGEVEFVLLSDGDSLWIGVGSDHTDRELERASMIDSKQICPNVLAHEVWDHAEVAPHWDRLELRSWTAPAPGEPERPYQSAPLAAILPPAELLALVRARGVPTDGLVIFGGTLPLLGGKPIYGSSFRCELHDPVLGRSLSCRYDIARLDYLDAPQAAGTAASVSG